MQANFKYELNTMVNVERLKQQGGALIEGAYVGFNLVEPQYYVSYYDSRNVRQTMYIEESKITPIS